MKHSLSFFAIFLAAISFPCVAMAQPDTTGWLVIDDFSQTYVDANGNTANCFSGQIGTRNLTDTISYTLQNPVVIGAGLADVTASGSSSCTGNIFTLIQNYADNYIPEPMGYEVGKSIRIGNACGGARVTALYYSTLVSADSLRFHYAVAFEAPGHGYAWDPFFIIQVRTQTADGGWSAPVYGDTIQAPLNGNYQPDTTADVGWHLSGGGYSGVSYKEWTPYTLNLSSYIGQVVRVEFISSTCAYSAHFGYACIAGAMTATSGSSQEEETMSYPFTPRLVNEKYNAAGELVADTFYCNNSEMMVFSAEPYIPVQFFNGFYTVEEVPYSPVDTTFYLGGLGTQLSTQLDDAFDTAAIAIPFPFFFFGVQKNSFRIGDNGMVTFTDNFYAGGSNANCPYSFNNPIPWDASTTPGYGSYFNRMHDAIYGVYEDLYLMAGGTTLLANQGIFYGILGEAPFRKVVVTWREIPVYNNPNNRQTYQIVFHEATNIIEVHVKRRGCCTVTNNGRGIIGIQNATGYPQVHGTPGTTTTWYVQDGAPAAFWPSGYNPTTSEFVQKSFRFTPQGYRSYYLAWYRLFDDGREPVALGTDPADTNGYTIPIYSNEEHPILSRLCVHPLGTARYVAVMGFHNANDDLYTLTDTITVVGCDSYLGDYCEPNPTSRDHQGLINVSFGGMVNDSVHPQSAPYYGDYHMMQGSVAAGTTAQVEITYATGYTYGTVIWVDWDYSFTFDDDEIVYAGTSTNVNPTTLTASFYVPVTMNNGVYRMRIAGADSHFDSYINGTGVAPDPCFTSTYAAAEDYTLVVGGVSDCPDLLGLMVADVTENSITLNWNDESPTPRSYTLYNMADSSVVNSNITGNSYTVTGLNGNTVYTFGLAANCSGGQSSSLVTASARTNCVLISQVPYFEDFEAQPTGSSTQAGFAYCWTRLNNGATYFGYPCVSGSTYNHTEGGAHGLYWYNSITSPNYGDYQYAILPPVDVSVLPINSLMLSFWARSSSTNFTPVFEVGVMEGNEDTSFTLIETVTLTGSTTWTEYVVNFSGYTGSGSYIAIRALRPASSWTAYVDDVTLDHLPTCPLVENLTVTDAMLSTATVVWDDTSANASWYVEYDSVPFTPGTGHVTPLQVTSPHCNLTGLDSATTYHVYVYPACGTEVLYRHTLFSTLNTAAASIPYFCDFEAEGTHGWDLINGTQENRWIVGDDTAHESSRSLYISNNDTSNAYTLTSASIVFASRNVVITDTGEYICTFDWKGQGESSYDFLRAALLPENTTLVAGDYSGFNNTSALPTGAIPLDGAFRLNESSDWQTRIEVFRIITPGVYRIVFLWRNDHVYGTQPPAAIDNVRLAKGSLQLTLAGPVTVTASSLGGTDTVQVHDTTVVTLTDTVYLTVTDTIHVFDTVFVTDTVTNTVYDTVDHYIYDTTIVTDTLWAHDTIYIHDTVYVQQEGIGDVEATDVKLYQRDGCIVVEGDLNGDVRVYDAVGRLLTTHLPVRHTSSSSNMKIPVPASGVYLVKIGNLPARRVVVIL